MSTARKVLIAAPVHPVLSDGLRAAGYELVVREQITRPEALDLIGDCEGVVTSTRLLLDRELLDAGRNLQWIGRMGSGMEIIDVRYAAERGIRCFSSPEGNRNAVAEHALGMLLALTNRIVISNEEVKQGYWRREENRGYELEGRTIGLIGFGNTGRAFAKKLQGFDMRILAYDKYNTEPFPPYVEQCPDLEPVFAKADIVSLHLPLTAETHKYVNANFLLKMTQAFIVINTSRGEVVDTEVLKKGLEMQKIRGACIDVWPEEPLERMGQRQRSILESIVHLPQVIVTPHIAGYTYEALYKMSSVLLAKISEA